jgi:hypothetical protein
MEDVLALYEKPVSEKEPVVCMDEKPVVLHADVRPPRPMRPGRIMRRDSEYKRCGTANVFCGVQPKAGRHFTQATPNRSSSEFADYLVEIAASYPEADTIHLVMDNLSSHSRKALVERFGDKIRRTAVGALHRALHAQTWQLAEPGGDRDQPVLPPVLGTTQNPVIGRPATTNGRMEPENEPRPCHHQLAVYAHKGSSQVRL